MYDDDDDDDVDIWSPQEGYREVLCIIMRDTMYT
jgi:hypothetical protein